MALLGESLNKLNRVEAAAVGGAVVMGGDIDVDAAMGAAVIDTSDLVDAAVSEDESKIAPNVLSALLPDSDVVVLPEVERIAGGFVYCVAKRVLDVIACCVALIILSIPMAIIAAKIKHESAGSAIYKQCRVGKDGKLFNVYKFRTMCDDAEVRGAQWAKDDDPRITLFGKKLRMSRFDELPQFWNVIKGDMSLVGPRPERPIFCDEFRKKIIGWDQRTLISPGITGLAQVRGGYDLLPKEKARLDIEYIESRNLWLDFKLICQTISVLFTHEGAR
ncbi:sugar transferase [Adlercreutzia sp. ZJ304]|uniref:sugar transferase n=1 Tax=Adlercreutzia sp. ZJ304 TaxID=2709791 RepID=UPI0019814B4B|nr:sugar transferase [Adlercreutzia sp. ZJ304]